MKITTRQATPGDLDAVCGIYDNMLAAEEAGKVRTGWMRGVYPTRKTAEDALGRGELFVLEADGKISGTGIINQHQLEAYRDIDWQYPVADHRVTVLHTFMIDPDAMARGLGGKFVEFYENYAIEHGAPYLRMDTNSINAAARQFYKKLGYKEKGFRECFFNGLKNVTLVMLEKLAQTTKK